MSQNIEVAGQPAADRILANVKQRARELESSGEITPYQVGIVLKALADHTAIMAMIAHRPDPTSPWPEATSIGRWFHDVGDNLLEKGS